MTTAETVVPVCEGCGRSRPDAARRRVDGLRVCQRCWQASRVFPCPDCGAEKRIATAARDPDGRPARCADCVTGDEDLTRLVAIACEIDDAEPLLPADAIVAAIDTAAPTPVERAVLAENLGFWPGSLISGASTGTRVLWRLIVALEAAGATAVVRPRCADCDRPRELAAEPAWSQRICGPCDRRRHAKPCARCDVVAVVGRRTDDGEPLCRNCWHADPSSHRRCGRCEKLGRINARDDDGTPVCMACYRDIQPHRTCSRCNRIAPVTARHDDGDLCGTCYRHVQPRRRCGGCGRHTRINKRARDGDPDLCAACNWAPVAVCSRCGDEAMCRHADNVGPPVCLRCLAIARFNVLLSGPDATVPEPFVGVLVPEPLGGLLRQLPWRRQIGPSGMVPGADRWLFPGRQAGRHIHPEHLRKRLAALGITSRPARHAALLQLSREVPAAVLADMLNIDEGTATAWAARSGGTWNDYAARRLAAPDP